MNLLQINRAVFRFKWPSFLVWLRQHKPEKNSIAPMQTELAAAQTASEVVTATAAPETITPLTWLQGIPSDMSFVVYVDRDSVQIMEIVAVERKAAINLFGVPIYTGKRAQWQALGKFTLRRKQFDAATAFQAQEDALNELESLLSARWHTSSGLARLDQEILQDAEHACRSPLDEDADPSQPVQPNAMTPLLARLQSRQTASDEAARIDETLICAFQRIGVALPTSSDVPPV